MACDYLKSVTRPSRARGQNRIFVLSLCVSVVRPVVFISIKIARPAWHDATRRDATRHRTARYGNGTTGARSAFSIFDRNQISVSRRAGGPYASVTKPKRNCPLFFDHRQRVIGCRAGGRAIGVFADNSITQLGCYAMQNATAGLRNALVDVTRMREVTRAYCVPIQSHG